MRSLVFPFFVILVACAGACSAANGDNQFTTTSGHGGAGAGSGTGGDLNLGGGFVGTGGGSGGSACSDAAKLVYLLSTDGDIWSFAPDKKEMKNLFPLSCPTPGDGNDWRPNSMAVDRNAVAWVNYTGSDLFGSDMGGRIFKVDTQKKTCVAANVQLPVGWYRLGMGFSTDTNGGDAETLFITPTGSLGVSGGLGHIDVGTGAVVTTPGPFNGDPLVAGESAELTGTGDAKLFGFFTTTPWARVAEIDKSTAKILSDDEVTGVTAPDAWAFSFWGGAFYLYTANSGAASKVSRFDPQTHAVDSSYVLTSPMTIVGAGVSTCAPLEPPS